ncbi:hypothetical protein [Novacetimonas sp. GS1]
MPPDPTWMRQNGNAMTPTTATAVASCAVDRHVPALLSCAMTP